MKNLKLHIGMTLASVLAVTVLAVGPVSAHNGEINGSGSSASSKDDRTTVSATTTGTSGSSDDSTATEIEHSTGDVSELRTRADKLVKSDREGKKLASTVIGRQKACKAREANLNRKITNYSKNAKAHLTKYDVAFAKLQAYQTNNKLTVSTYEALVATANTQKTAATAAVDTLAKVSVGIDCTSDDPAASVATVKTAVQNAKTALKAYRTSVKNVLVALMAAKGGVDDSAATSTKTPADVKETN